jgi:lipoprotein-releasing system ATP-binding protein
LTLIIVTHNERLAARMGKTIRLVDGRIQENGNP